MSIEQTSFIFRYKIFVEDMCSGFFTFHWLLLASSWWALSIHPLCFDTRYLFSQFLAYHGCPAESLSFIPLSFTLYHLKQDIHFPQISGYHRCPVESLSFIPLSFLLYSLIQDIFYQNSLSIIGVQLSLYPLSWHLACSGTALGCLQLFFVNIHHIFPSSVFIVIKQRQIQIQSITHTCFCPL